MLKLIITILVSAAFPVACPASSTRAELDALVRAEQDVITWCKDRLASPEPNGPPQDFPNITRILGDNVVKSELGKQIRENLHITVAFAKLTMSTLTERVQLLKKVKALREGAESRFIEGKLLQAAASSMDLTSLKSEELIAEAGILKGRAQQLSEASDALAKQFEAEAAACYQAFDKLGRERKQMFEDMYASLPE